MLKNTITLEWYEIIGSNRAIQLSVWEFDIIMPDVQLPDISWCSTEEEEEGSYETWKSFRSKRARKSIVGVELIANSWPSSSSPQLAQGRREHTIPLSFRMVQWCHIPRVFHQHQMTVLSPQTLERNQTCQDGPTICERLLMQSLIKILIASTNFSGSTVKHIQNYSFIYINSYC